jgi:NAD(P)-dependent dehydrogenase (short-subunit alcohol dehydrogenase family)
MKNIIVITGASSGFRGLAARALAIAGHTAYASIRESSGRNAAQVEAAKLRPHEIKNGGLSCFQLSELLVGLTEVLLAFCSEWVSEYALLFATRPRATSGHSGLRSSLRYVATPIRSLVWIS